VIVASRTRRHDVNTNPHSPKLAPALHHLAKDRPSALPPPAGARCLCAGPRAGRRLATSEFKFLIWPHLVASRRLPVGLLGLTPSR
jgi:hypothetical protein